MSYKELFTQIYEGYKFGGTNESRSGLGSTLEETSGLRDKIKLLIREKNIKSVVDIPCGDFNWMKEIVSEFKYYRGVDIVKDLIKANKEKYKNFENVDFMVADVITEFDKCIKVCFKINSLELELKNLLFFNNIIDFLDIEFQNIDKFLEIVLLLIKKISKNEEIIKNCVSKIHCDDKNNYIHDSPEKFIAWFCQ